MYEIINDFYRFWKRFQVIIQQLLWLQEDLQCFHPKSGNEKKRVFRENTVLTARHPALSGMNESDQTFFVDIGKCFRYHTHYLILAETTSKNLCSDHSWKHQRDERDQRRSSRSSQISFIRTRFFSWYVWLWFPRRSPWIAYGCRQPVNNWGVHSSIPQPGSSALLRVSESKISKKDRKC